MPWKIEEPAAVAAATANRWTNAYVGRFTEIENKITFVIKTREWNESINDVISILNSYERGNARRLFFLSYTLFFSSTKINLQLSIFGKDRLFETNK